jgi:hypothetical protein
MYDRSGMPEVRDLIWDDANEAHIAAHGVTTDEVEEVCFGRYWMLRSGSSGRYRVLGQTHAGRYLLVVFDEEAAGRFYPVTARNMAGDERQRYRRWRGYRPWR